MCLVLESVVVSQRCFVFRVVFLLVKIFLEECFFCRCVFFLRGVHFWWRIFFRGFFCGMCFCVFVFSKEKIRKKRVVFEGCSFCLEVFFFFERAFFFLSSVFSAFLFQGVCFWVWC